MRILVIFILSIGLGMSFLFPAYGTIETTQFDLEVTSDDFYEPNLNKNYLIMKPGDSQQVTIQITNNDSKPHTINLFMEKGTPRPERNFVFEPAQLEINPGETKTSILTVSPSSDASTGTTIWHTFVAKSTTFGAKAFGFYVEVDTEITPPLPDMVRRGAPGSMFSSNTDFDISEEEAIKQIPYDIESPDIPDEYLFQGTYGSGQPKQLIYSKTPISSDTRDLDFWDNGGLMISFHDKKHFTFDERLGFLGSGEQQVRINGKNGTASESIPISTQNGEKIYSNSRVNVYLDDVQLRITSQMPLEQILRIAESMVKENYQSVFQTKISHNTCECTFPVDYSKLASQSDYAFVGLARDIDPVQNKNHELVIFDIYAIAKGNIVDSMFELEQANDVTCGVNFEIGTIYNVFVTDGDPMTTNVCSTLPLSDSNNYANYPYSDLVICGEGTTLVDGECHVLKTDENPPRDCLIATASYGSELAPQVQMLREIRDSTLLNTQSGKIFMNGFNTIYYSFSPTIAQWENDNDTFKEAVKLFITPMISALSIMTLADDSETDVILHGVSTLGIIIGMYVIAPTTIIWKLRKRT